MIEELRGEQLPEPNNFDLEVVDAEDFFLPNKHNQDSEDERPGSVSDVVEDEEERKSLSEAGETRSEREKEVDVPPFTLGS
mmetsp:Transcript_1953/g.1416  ORF Transcript_1953/g.1416 Transcript_1953/m.1416 type:complete len:81 (+) Transcript_1953:40-282(+)